MPIGTGAETLTFLPEVPYVVDPNAFFAGTEKNSLQVNSWNAPGGGQSQPFDLPRSGVVSKIFIQFDGQLVVTAGGTQPIPSFLWPYGLLNNFTLSANGSATDLYTCNGLDLAALRFARFPAYVEHVDLFPGAVGGGGSAIAAGTYPIHLTWEVPIAIDDTTLVAALFAQSSSLTLRCLLTQETIANLIAPGGTAADWAITGTFTVQETQWEIPVDAKGNLVLPDITRLHQVIAFDTPFTNTGEVLAPLIRTAGQLERLFVRTFGATNAPLTGLPGTAAAATLDAIRLQYGGGIRKPLVYPKSSLLAINNQHYGAPLPYDSYAFDFIRENPLRDAVYMQGVTELGVVPTINPAVAVGAGAVVHTVQEMLL